MGSFYHFLISFSFPFCITCISMSPLDRLGSQRPSNLARKCGRGRKFRRQVGRVADGYRKALAVEGHTWIFKMNPLLVSNTIRTFHELNKGFFNFSDEYKALAQGIPFNEKPLEFRPYLPFGSILYESESGITCAQRDYMEFYVLEHSIRYLFRAVNPLIAGNILENNNLYGPSIISYYTAAYHALLAFLALEGHAFLEWTIWPIPSHRPGDYEHRDFIAKLTEQNKWIFEGRKRRHKVKWDEIYQAFGSRPNELPKCFHDLFEYLYSGVYQPGIDLVELIRSPGQYRVKLADRFEEFLQRISEIRHTAVYRSFGSDPHVFANLWNRDTFSESGIESQTHKYGAFSVSLLNHVASDIWELINRLEVGRDVGTALGLFVYFNWFDNPKFEQIRNHNLNSKIFNITKWINGFATGDRDG